MSDSQGFDPSPESPRTGITKIIGSLSERNYAGEVRGIAVLVIDAQGRLQTSYAYDGGMKFYLIAGAQILNKDLLESLNSTPYSEDPLA